MQVWRLDDQQQTLVIAAVDNAMAFVAYWGAPLPSSVCLHTLIASQQRDVTGGMIDVNEEVSLCPVEGNAYAGQPGLYATDSHAKVLLPQFQLASVEADNHAIELSYVDQNLQLTYQAVIAKSASHGVWQLSSRLMSAQPISVHWLAAPVLPAADGLDSLQEYGGRWLDEFQSHERQWGPSALVRENRTGRTGHEHFPALLVKAQASSFTQGEVYAWHYGWSGGHKMIAEQLPDGRRQVQFGHVSGAYRGMDTQFDSATLYVSYSQWGINGVSVPLQRLVKSQLPVNFADQPRPLHYNCWEAIYFDHSVEKLSQLAQQAAYLGAERFVLDDGWFGKRNDDTTSLGDWWVDKHKYPQGLQPFVDVIHRHGMGFGLWFEPEMINEDSDCYRQHPEWVLGAANQTRGRQQLVLNMALLEVQNYLYEAISTLLEEYAIEYIKWDHNRVLPYTEAAQTQAVYQLLAQLRQAFPNTEIESCSSGGGRIDYGILQHAQRVWLSDSNDALVRLRIQNNSATFLPMLVTGSHVGPRHCHTSGRSHSMAFRAWVAAQRHMGIEMNPQELDAEETQQLIRVISWWKQQRLWMQQADILRLDTADSTLIAEQHIDAQGQQFIAFVGVADNSQQICPRPLRLTGLVAEADYAINLVNKEELVGLSRGNNPLKQDQLVLNGAFLMNYGLTLPWQFPNAMWVIEGKRQ